MSALARFDIRFRWLIVAVWVAGVLLAMHLLPSLGSVTQNNTVKFLPASSPSQQAAQLAAPFQGHVASSSAINPATAIIIASRSSSPLTSTDDAAIARVERQARRTPGVILIRDEGSSRDGQAREALVTVSEAAAKSDTLSGNVVTAIRASFGKARSPAGLSFHLTGQLATSVDGSKTNANAIAKFTVIFLVVVLFLVYRALLAPLLTLLPAGLALLLAQPLIAEAVKAGLSVADFEQGLLIVLLLGAGTDYGLFLAFRLREELAHGREPHEALVAAMANVGRVVTYSAFTVAAALLCLLLAPFGVYQGFGPAMAIGIALVLLASLTLTPALLAIFGRAAFWPTHPQPATLKLGFWGRVCERVVQRPLLTLAAGVLLFGGLAAGLVGYRSAGLTTTAPTSSDSAVGARVLAAHFSQANAGSDQLLLRYRTPIWNNPAVLARAQTQLAASPVFATIVGPLGTGPGTLTGGALTRLHQQLGPAARLPSTQPSTAPVGARAYQAYRATAQFISTDGKTVEFHAALRAGPYASAAAASAIPHARSALDAVAHTTGAATDGVAGQDAAIHDIDASSNRSILIVVPVVLAAILILLAILLRSLVAPWYLAATVGFSYLAALGFASIVFVHLSSGHGLFFIVPLLLFVFSMAIGEDYNILIISRIREETGKHPSFRQALTHAIGITGSTVTSAGVILAGTFVVLGLAGGRADAQQLGFPIAFGVALDTFFVRTLLVPSIAILLGRWNWWPTTPPVAETT